MMAPNVCARLALLLTAGSALLTAGSALVAANAQLPVVDLSYALQQATSYNATGDFYLFSNIRFAQAPVGNLRFKAPQPPLTDRSVVHDGSDINPSCPAATPNWIGAAYQFIGPYLAGQNVNISNLNIPPATKPNIAAPGPGEVPEDCLFLDVVAPKKIFDAAQNNTSNKGAPVLVWIYGGGYTLGNKNQYGNPAGLIARSQNNGDDGVVYVAMNYRLGAFGWLSGPSFEYSGGVANAGLYDQRLALQWVQDNIAKFGGDPNQVTVLGESAGAGSIMHQITAFGGRTTPVFQRAVLQSTAFAPIVSMHQEEGFYQDFLSKAGATSFEELQNLDYQTLQAANSYQIQNSSYGTFTYGPVIDGVFAPQSPAQLLAKGQFQKDLEVITGHNLNEGILFTPYFITDDTVFREQLIILLPDIAAFPDVIDYIMNVMYPPDYSGAQGYTDIIGRVNKAVTEGIFTCNTFYLAKAFNNQTWSYEFAVPPGIHGNDISSTFFNGGDVPNTQVALTMQEYITAFALRGDPNEPQAPYFPRYQNNATLNILNATGSTLVNDPTANERCNWWAKGLFY